MSAVVERQSASEAYRDLVFAGAADVEPDLLRKARKIYADFAHDKATFAKRKQAAEQLQQGRADLERALELERQVEEYSAADTLLTDVRTVGELFARLNEVQAARTPGSMTAQKETAHRDKMNARNATLAATQALAATSDPAIESRIDALRKQRGALQHEISNRGKLTPEVLEQQRQIVLDASDRIGRSRPDNGDYNLIGITLDANGELPQQFSGEVLRRLTKTRLAEIDAQVGGAQKATRENARNCEEIARLEAEVEEVEKQKLLPENMAWSE